MTATSKTADPVTSNEPLVRVRGLQVVFPPRRGRGTVQAVRDVSFDIEAGRTLGLVGESGSGKTTKGRAVLQLQQAAGGSVRLLGRELTSLSHGALRGMRRHMQFVLQNPYSSLHPRMTAGQILAEPLKVHRSVPRRDIPERIDELMLLVRLDPTLAARYPHELSGGQRQRIVIARALAVNPDFVVCDEPVSALDVRTQAQIVELLRELQDRLRLSYLFIAHDLAVVRALAHRVAVMYRGRIVEMGDAADVYNQPVHPYTRSLLDSVPIPDPALQRAKLAEPAAEWNVDGQDGTGGPCALCASHAAAGSSAWHEVGPRHGVSCHYWPAQEASITIRESGHAC